MRYKSKKRTILKGTARAEFPAIITVDFQRCGVDPDFPEECESLPSPGITNTFAVVVAAAVEGTSFRLEEPA